MDDEAGDGRVYTTSNAGHVYSLEAATGCIHWAYHSQAVVRSGFSVGRLSQASDRIGVFFGDIHGQAYGLDASTGEVIWKVQTDSHPLARLTGTPVLHDGRVYVPVASLEEPESGQADYTCCTLRGVLAALDAATGRQIWKTYTIPDEPEVIGQNSRGKDMHRRVRASGSRRPSISSGAPSISARATPSPASRKRPMA